MSNENPKWQIRGVRVVSRPIVMGEQPDNPVMVGFKDTWANKGTVELYLRELLEQHGYNVTKEETDPDKPFKMFAVRRDGDQVTAEQIEAILGNDGRFDLTKRIEGATTPEG